MTWLILGGKGQLGIAIARVLQERKIVYFAWGSAELDIRDTHAVASAVLKVNPEVIVNAAAWTDVDGAESDPIGAQSVNAHGASNVALAAKLSDAVLIHISTDYVFSGISKVPWNEYDLRSPISVYGKSKAEGEYLVLSQYPEKSYVFRTAWLYSPWGKNFAKTMTRLAIRDDNPVKVVSDQVGQPTSSIDLANQIVDTVKAELPFGIYHGTNSGTASWYHFACKVFELCGAASSRVLPVSSNEFVRAAQRPSYSVLGHSAWSTSGAKGISVSPLRDWNFALIDTMPLIIAIVKGEA